MTTRWMQLSGCKGSFQSTSQIERNRARRATAPLAFCAELTTRKLQESKCSTIGSLLCLPARSTLPLRLSINGGRKLETPGKALLTLLENRRRECKNDDALLASLDTEIGIQKLYFANFLKMQQHFFQKHSPHMSSRSRRWQLRGVHAAHLGEGPVTGVRLLLSMLLHFEVIWICCGSSSLMIRCTRSFGSTCRQFSSTQIDDCSDDRPDEVTPPPKKHRGDLPFTPDGSGKKRLVPRTGL